MFLIGEFAHLAGVTAKTLRHYHRRGIFRPAWVDPGTGYRYYSPAQLPELRRIIALRDVGVPLGEVAELVSEGADLRPLLRRRRNELEKWRNEIDRDLKALDIWVEMADAGPEVVIRGMDAQLIAGLRAEVRPGEDIGPLFYELEQVVRNASARASLPPGVVTPLQNAETARSIEVFVPVTRSVATGRVSSRRLSRTRVAAIIHRGPYEGMPAARQSLQDWVDGAGYRPTGELRLLYLSFGAEPELELPDAYLADRPTDFVTEIQIPITVP